MRPVAWLLFVHIAAAATWIGGGLVLSLIGSRARRSGDIGVMRDFAATLYFVGLRVFTPAVLVLLASGVWMVLIGEGDFGQLWVLLSLGGFAVAFLVGAGYLSGVVIELGRVTNQPDPDLDVASRVLGRWINGYWVVLAVLVFTLWDMVFKPGL